MNKWVVGMILAVLIAFGSVIGFNIFVNHKIENTLANLPEPNYPVTVEKLTPSTWKQSIDTIGVIEPFQGVAVSNKVAGTVDAIHFKNGAVVKSGTLLVNLDNAVERAQLKAQQVQLPSVRDDYQRLKKLYAKNLTSQQSLETAQSKYETLVANIAMLQATIEQRQIKAPFSGVLGIKNINLGQYIPVGTDIVRLDDLSVMRVRFNVPQAQFGHLHIDQAINLTVESYPGRIYQGHINAIEPVINDQTGQIMVQAEIPNDDRSLRGGMFADINVELPPLNDQFVVPQTAIVFALYGNSIFVVDEKDNQTRVRQVSVEVLNRSGANALIKGKINFNEQVVTTGTLNLSNHTQVTVVANPLTLPKSMPKL